MIFMLNPLFFLHSSERRSDRVVRNEINNGKVIYRQSGIELLKLLAMFLVVLSHSAPDAAARLSETKRAFIDGNLCSANWQYAFVGGYTISARLETESL